MTAWSRVALGGGGEERKPGRERKQGREEPRERWRWALSCGAGEVGVLRSQVLSEGCSRRW